MSEPSLNLTDLRAALERANHPRRMAETSMTTLDETQRRHRLGVVVEPGVTAEAVRAGFAAAAAAATAATADAIGAPTSFDLRSVNGVNYPTGVRDQGNCGSCVAFGVVGAMESVARYTWGRPTLAVDLSEAHLFYGHGGTVGVTCDTGWFPEPASNFAQNPGITFEDYYPYVARQPGTVNAAWPDHRANITGWHSVTNDPAGMKAAISSRDAITASCTSSRTSSATPAASTGT